MNPLSISWPRHEQSQINVLIYLSWPNDEPRQDRIDVGWETEREELNIRLEEKDIKQVKNFVYLGGHISENGVWVWRFDA